jgi:beta-lactam-binding protein with PASTA domain
MNEMDGRSGNINLPPPTDVAQKIKKRTVFTSIKKIGWLILGIICLYFLLDLLIMPIYTRHWQRVQVGNVLNMSYTAAQKMLKKEGLHVVKAEEKYDENYPPGFVLFQNPEAGAYVKKGRRIYLTIGKGLRIFTMPKLIGMAERDALFTLEEHNLVVGKTSYDLDNFYPEGVVIGQSKPAGEDITIGETVDIVVSLGVEPSNFIVPDIVGKSLNDAKAAILRAGLAVGNIHYEIFDKLLPNTVIEQSKTPGTQVHVGDSIDLTVSRLTSQDNEE